MTIPKHYKRLFIVIALLVVTVGTFATNVNAAKTSEGATDDDGDSKHDDGEKTMEFKTPDMTEEEEHSYHMPIHMLCDGCKLISAMLSRQFLKASYRKSGTLAVLLESEAIEAVETVCEDKYENYGAKEVDGVLRLTGPHTEVENLPGVTSGGGKWPNRIKRLCSRYWDELGDDELYKAWRDQSISFPDYLCNSPNRPRDACYKTQGEATTTNASEKKPHSEL